jgi:hypothetical protein
MTTRATENIISQINMNVFFREFTFSKNNFVELDSNQKLEFADNVVWLDDIFFIYQIKDRALSDSDDEKWFDNKVLKKGVKQIKNTLKYLENYSGVIITNEKGHKINISEAKRITPRKIIIYTPSDSFPDAKRFIKFYDSSQIGLIHLFHSEDYYWICKYLLTPAEVEEYLNFRESFYSTQKQVLNHFPEQYILAHFLETLDTEIIVPRYIDNLKIIDKESIDFDISFLIDNFTNNIKLINHETEYYPIIKEIAKLNRSEIAEFKKRFVRCLEICKKEDIVLPYRIYIPRTDCGFVFIPLFKEKAAFWKTALNNFTLAQKYDQKAGKCVGVIIFEMQIENTNYFDIYWEYAEFPWEFDSELDSRLKANFPFRDAKMKRIENRYKN